MSEGADGKIELAGSEAPWLGLARPRGQAVNVSQVGRMQMNRVQPGRHGYSDERDEKTQARWGKDKIYRN